MNTTTDVARTPWAGIAVSALSVVIMVGIGWAMWDSLPDPIVTREATADRAGVALPKLVAVAALPMALLLIAAVMVVATKLGNRLRPLVDPRLVASPDSQTRSMNTLFTLLPLFLIVLQAGFLLSASGSDFPLNRVVAVAFGILLMGLGNLLPKILPASASRRDTMGHWLLAWQRSQRGGGIAMMLVGAACVVAAFWAPPMWVAVTAAALIAVIYVAMLLGTVLRIRRE